MNCSIKNRPEVLYKQAKVALDSSQERFSRKLFQGNVVRGGSWDWLLPEVIPGKLVPGVSFPRGNSHDRFSRR